MALTWLKWFATSREGEVEQAFLKRRSKYPLLQERQVILSGDDVQYAGGTFLKSLLHFQTTWSVLPVIDLCVLYYLSLNSRFLFSNLLSSKPLNIWSLSWKLLSKEVLKSAARFTSCPIIMLTIFPGFSMVTQASSNLFFKGNSLHV